MYISSLAISVKSPNIVSIYNKNMGGVDKLDGLIALYRIFFRNRKWYHRIVWHLIDICVCNAWLIYRRDFDAAAKYRAHCSGTISIIFLIMM